MVKKNDYMLSWIGLINFEAAESYHLFPRGAQIVKVHEADDKTFKAFIQDYDDDGYYETVEMVYNQSGVNPFDQKDMYYDDDFLHCAKYIPDEKFKEYSRNIHIANIKAYHEQLSYLVRHFDKFSKEELENIDNAIEHAFYPNDIIDDTNWAIEAIKEEQHV